MNEYCQHKIRHFHQALVHRQFDQDDVALLILLAREYSAKGSILRELGDFLAHPHDKDRGIVLESVRSAAASFDKDCRRYFRDDDFKPPIFRGLGTLEQLLKDISHVFGLAGIESLYMSEKDPSARDFAFCVIFLLSSCRIKHDGKLYELKVNYGHSLTLFISYESKNFPRHFATLPVLVLPNVWIANTDSDLIHRHILRNHIVRRFEGGLLAAISFADDDLSSPKKRPEDFERGKAWPLPDLAW